MRRKPGAKVYPGRKRRRLKSKAVKVSALVAFFTIILFFVCVYRVEAFRVKVVEVTGVDRVSAESIYDDSQIVIGENLMSLPVDDMRANILGKQPLIKDAAIYRILPSRVKIQIYERQPFAFVTNRRQFYLIDRDGIVLEKTNGISDRELFLVESDSIMHAEVGEKLVFPYSDVFGEMCKTLDDHLGGRYSQVRFDQRGIKLFLKDGVYILLGDGGEIEKKIMLVPIIIQKLREADEKFEGLNLEFLEVPSFIKKSV